METGKVRGGGKKREREGLLHSPGVDQTGDLADDRTRLSGGWVGR
jgi:hypothetical protein